MNELLPPWKLEAIQQVWDEYSKPLGLRSFSHGKSSGPKRSQQRLTRILRDNAQLLHCRSDDDIEDICDAFETTLQVALVAMQEMGIETVNHSLDAQYQLTLGFWQFTRPDIKNICFIADQALGRTPAVVAAQTAEKQAKAQAIKRFKLECDDFISTALRLSDGDQQKLTAALKRAAHGLALAEDLLRA